MNKEKNYIKYFKDYIQLGLPIMIGTMTMVFISWGDNIMISKLGEINALAAASLANNICSIPLLFLIGISTVLAPMVAASTVKNDYKKTTQILKHSLAINVSFGILSSILLMSFSNKLNTMGQDPEVGRLAQGYLCIIAASIVPISISNILKRYLDTLGWTIHTMCLSILSGITNVILNYILIYGKLGFPALGLNGAGWATLFTRVIIMCIYLCYAILLKKKKYIIDIAWTTYKKSHLIKLLKASLPSAIELAVRMSYFSAATIMLGWISPTSQAATSILFDMLRFAIMLPLAVGICSSVLIGRQWGMKNKRAIHNLGQVGYILSFGLMSIMSLFLYLVYPYILDYLYRPEPDAKILIESLLKLMILLHFVDGVNLVSLGIFRGMQDTFMPFIMCGVAYISIGLPIGYLLAFVFGWKEAGVWWGLILGLTTSACVLYIRFYYTTRNHLSY